MAPSLLRPAPLQKGDTIGVVAPSYSPREGWLTRGVKALERSGYTVILDPELLTMRRFLRREDERRAENSPAAVSLPHGRRPPPRSGAATG